MSYRIGVVLPKKSHDVMTKVKQCLRYVYTTSYENPINEEETIYYLHHHGRDTGFSFLYDDINQTSIEDANLKESLTECKKRKLKLYQNEPKPIRDDANEYTYILNLILTISNYKRVGIVMYWDHEEEGEPYSSMPNETLKLADFTIEFILMCKPEVIYYVERDETVDETIEQNIKSLMPTTSRGIKDKITGCVSQALKTLDISLQSTITLTICREGLHVCKCYLRNPDIPLKEVVFSNDECNAIVSCFQQGINKAYALLYGDGYEGLDEQPDMNIKYTKVPKDAAGFCILMELNVENAKNEIEQGLSVKAFDINEAELLLNISSRRGKGS